MRRFMPFTPLHDALTRTGYACFCQWTVSPHPGFLVGELSCRFCFLPAPTKEFNGGEIGGLALWGELERQARKEAA